MILITAPIIRYLGISGITLYPFVFVRDANLRHDVTLLQHERIHLRQQAELLVLPFYILYLAEYLLRRIMGLNHKEAYRKLSFEREAYENDHHSDYLNNRKPFAWIKYY